MREQRVFEFQKSLMPLEAEGFLSSEASRQAVLLFKEHLDAYCDDLTDALRERVVIWESGMGEDDKSLYSLGLRRAIDLISETDPTESTDDD